MKGMATKYRELYAALKSNEADTLVIHDPTVLGDDFEELIFNLDKIANSGKTLRILPVKERNKK